MKAIFLICVSCVLSGCALFDPFVKKETVVITQYEYIVRQADESLKKKPPYPPPIDIATADQMALSYWLLQNENRMLDLEATIDRLIKFYEKPVSEEEKAAAKAKSDKK